MSPALRLESLAPMHELPSVVEYLRGLPAGWNSFPTCMAHRDLLESLRPALALHSGLGAPVLESLVERLTATRDWVHEVDHVGLLLALHDAAFHGDSERFLRWMVERGAARMTTMDVASLHGQSVSLLAAEAPALWARFHRGTSVRLTKLGDGTAELVLAHPAPLFPRVLIEYFARSFAIALVRVDGPQPRVEFETRPRGDDAETFFHAAWSLLE